MRLIDADALKNELIECTPYAVDPVYRNTNSNIDMFTVMEILDELPTIDVVPVARGEWIVTDAYPHRVYCSLCYKTNVPNEEWLYEKNDYPKYCMWLGADMRRESEVDYDNLSQSASDNCSSR